MKTNRDVLSLVKNIDGALIIVQDKTVEYKTNKGEFIEEVFRNYQSRTLNPDSDISGEPQEVQDVCNAVWTEEVKAAWVSKQEADNSEDKQEADNSEE